MAAAAPAPPSVLLVSKGVMDAHPGVVDELARSAAFRVKPAAFAVEADLLLPGVLTVAVVLVADADMLLTHRRESALRRMVAAKKRFKDSLVILKQRLSLSHTLLNRLRDTNNLPPCIVCSDDAQIAMALCALAKIFTKERDEQRAQQLQLMHKALHSRAVVRAALCSIPDLGSEEQDVILLQDCFGSVARIASLTARQVTELTPCSSQSARAVEAFFHPGGPSAQ